MKNIKLTNYFNYMIGKAKKYFPIVLALQITTLSVGLINFA